jgi:GT2 family glycosyltransferase
LLPPVKNSGADTPPVCVVLANWNGANYTVPCVESLKNSDYPDLRVIVVDDASTDDSSDRIARRFPGLEILRQPVNQGVSQARNRGIARAAELDSAYVLILDNDTRVDRSLVSHLVATAKARDDRAAVGPKIYYSHDPARLWFAYGRLSLWTGFYSNPAYNSIDSRQFEKVVDMDAASSCCVLIPMEILKQVGGFNPALTWNEDVDWSLRCKRAGYSILYCPQGKVWHIGGGSSRKLERASIRYMLTRNQLWTLRSVGRPWHLASRVCTYPAHCFFRLVKMGLDKEWDCMRAELLGAKDGFFGPIPKWPKPAQPHIDTNGIRKASVGL